MNPLSILSSKGRQPLRLVEASACVVDCAYIHRNSPHHDARRGRAPSCCRATAMNRLRRWVLSIRLSCFASLCLRSSTSASVLVSQYLGARLNDRVGKVVGVSLLVNLAIGLLISSILYFKASAILRLMGLDDVLSEGVGYMRIVGAFCVLSGIVAYGIGRSQGINRAIYPMLVVGLVNLLNIFGNYVLIFGRFGLLHLVSRVLQYPPQPAVPLQW